MASGAVDNWIIAHKFAVVNQNGPEVDENEQADEGNLLAGEQEDEDVVWHTLSEAVEGMEGVGGERRWHDPLVMGLVQTLVDERVVETTMDPVNTEIGEHEEQRVLEPVVQRERSLMSLVEELAIAANFSDHEWREENRHQGHGFHGLLHFQSDLVAEVLRVLEGLLVEDEEVRQGSENEVEQNAEQPIAEDTSAHPASIDDWR